MLGFFLQIYLKISSKKKFIIVAIIMFIFLSITTLNDPIFTYSLLPLSSLFVFFYFRSELFPVIDEKMLVFFLTAVLYVSITKSIYASFFFICFFGISIVTWRVFHKLFWATVPLYLWVLAANLYLTLFGLDFVNTVVVFFEPGTLSLLDFSLSGMNLSILMLNLLPLLTLTFLPFMVRRYKNHLFLVEDYKRHLELYANGVSYHKTKPSVLIILAVVSFTMLAISGRFNYNSTLGIYIIIAYNITKLLDRRATKTN